MSGATAELESLVYPLDWSLLVAGLVIAVCVTGALVWRLIIRDPAPGKWRRWLRGIGDAISTLISA